jgi:hypothetical protein
MNLGRWSAGKRISLHHLLVRMGRPLTGGRNRQFMVLRPLYLLLSGLTSAMHPG